MKCMCAQTRPRFILSSERVFWEMEFEPMLTPREKSPLPENFPRGGSNPLHCGQRAQTLPTSYSGPQTALFDRQRERERERERERGWDENWKWGFRWRKCERLGIKISVCMHVCICVRARACVYVCVCV